MRSLPQLLGLLKQSPFCSVLCVPAPKEKACSMYINQRKLGAKKNKASDCTKVCPSRCGLQCSVLPRVALCCSVCCSVCCRMVHCVAACCIVLQRASVCCSVLQCVAACCMVLQRVAFCCSVLLQYSDTNIGQSPRLQVVSYRQALTNRTPLLDACKRVRVHVWQCMVDMEGESV